MTDCSSRNPNELPIAFTAGPDGETGVLRVANPATGTWIVQQDVAVPELADPGMKTVRRFGALRSSPRTATAGGEPSIFVEAAVQHPLTLIANADVGRDARSFTTTDMAGFNDGRVAGRPLLLQALVARTMSPGRFDPELVRRHLMALDDALTNLRKHQGRPREALEDPDEAWIVERGLQLCAQTALDIATHFGAQNPRRASVLAWTSSYSR